MNYALLFRLLTYVTTAVAAAFLAALAVGFYFKEHQTAPDAMVGLAISVGAVLLLTLAFHLLGRRATIRLFRKEAFALIGLSWLLASLLGALPFLLIHPEASWGDAIFESASGFTTTGASVFTGFEEWPRSLLFYRCLTQWIGGLGVLVFFVAVLGSLGVGGKILFTNEFTGSSTDIDTGHFQRGVLQILYYFVALSALCCLALRFSGLGWYDAICHTFTTVATGGFSTQSLSIESFQNPAVEWTMILFMILGATGFLVQIRLWKGHFSQFRRYDEFKVFMVIIVAATITITILRLESTGEFEFEGHLRAAAFQVVSIATTSGFTTENFDAWQTPAKMILLGLMIIGGCAGSTAGGIKISRLIILYRFLWQNLEKSFRPNVVRTIKMNGKVLKADVRDSALGYLLLLGAILFISIIGIALLEQTESVTTGISIVVSTLFNIGPGLDQVGPYGNYGFLKDTTKLLLSLLMIIGRLEVYAILVLMVPGLWKKFS